MRSLLAGLVLLGFVVQPALARQEPAVEKELRDWLERAEQSLEEQELQAAASHYRSALAEGWLLLGGIAAGQGDLERAQEAFRQASVSVADTRRAHTFLAIIHLRRGELTEALSLLRGVVVASPGDGDARRLLAQALVAAGRTEEAVQELEEALAASGGREAETAFALATGYLRLDRVADAERLLERIAVELPGAQTQVLLGRTYRDFRLFERAREVLEEALRLDPEVRRAHYYLGTIELLERGRDGLGEAIESFRRELADNPRDPMTHLYLGIALTEQRRFEDALESLAIAAGWEPTSLEALRFIGRSQLGLERPAEAVAALEKALVLAETGPTRRRQLAAIHYQLGTALRRTEAAERAATHFAAAEELSEEVVEGERDRFAGLVDLAAEADLYTGIRQTPVEAMVASLDPPAREDLRRTVRRELSRINLNLGVLEARRQRFPRAVGLFESAAQLDPDLPGLQASLGAALFKAGRFAPAAVALEKALAQDSASGELRRMLALSLLNVEDYGRAADLLRDDQLRRADPALDYAFGLALVRSGRGEEAEGVFSRLLAERADWPELHVFLGQARAHQGDFPAAIAALERALELSPAVAEANGTLGVIYLRQGRLAEAEEALRAELASRPGDPRSRYHLATVLDLAGRPEAAREELRALLQARPEMAEARYLLGKIRLAEGAAEEAALHLEAAAALTPEDASVHYQLAQAYQRLGKLEMASRELELYRDLKQRPRSDPP